MAAMASDMGLPGAPPTAGLSGTPPSAAQAKQAADLLRNNPDMVKQAAEMMQSMSDEELARMAAMPGAPPGMSPAMMKASIGMLGFRLPRYATIRPIPTDMLSKMDPGQLERMAQQATGPAGPSAANPLAGLDPAALAAGDPGANAELLAKMQDPSTLKMMQEMVSGMEPDAFASLMAAQGVQMTPEQAAQAQRMVKGLTPNQMAWLTRASTAVAQAQAAFRRARQALQGRWVLILSLAVLLLAFVLRHYGVL